MINNRIGYTLTTHSTCATAALISVYGTNFYYLRLGDYIKNGVNKSLFHGNFIH